MQARNTIASEDHPYGAPQDATEERQQAGEAASSEEGGIGIEFLSNLAHQLRSPLSSLRVWVDLLKDPAALANPEDAKKLVEGIERATTRLERQVSDVLEIGYLESGTLTFESGLVDATEQIAAAVGDVDHAARSRSITFDLKVADQPSSVLSSETRLRQIVGCLLSNAIRFSPVGGTIRLVAGVEPHLAGSDDATDIAQSRFAGRADRSYYICVSNDGPAIPGELHHQIFLPFERAGRKDGHGGGGSGLGLAIALGLVKLHGGGMWVRSGSDGGAEFEFSLPLISAGTAGPNGQSGKDLN